MSNFRRKLLISQESEEPVDPTLIFFAPLSYGDLTDHISGNVLQNYQDLVSWDSEKQMYKVIFTDNFSKYSYWDVDFTTKLMKNSSQNYTMFAECQTLLKSNFNYPNFFSIGSFTNRTTYRPSLSVPGGSMPNEPNKLEFKQRADVVKDGCRYRYANGVLIQSVTLTSGSSMLCSNWNNDQFTRICLNPKSESESGNFTIYIRNIRIYNRALSPEEMIDILN